MKIVVITQNEPFYLAKNLKYLIEILPEHSRIVGCVVNDVSPFGKKESFLKKAHKTLNVFGLKFFIHYSIKFVFSKITKSKNVFFLLKKKNIPLIKLKENINHPNSVALIKQAKPDLLVSILGNQIFKEPIINLTDKGCINLHTALLPKYRGLMPTFWVLKNEETHTGVSVFFVDKGIDSGPIIIQKKVLIGSLSQEELIELTKRIGMESISEAIDLIEKNQVSLIENNECEKSYYSFPSKSDVQDFNNKGKLFF